MYLYRIDQVEIIFVQFIDATIKPINSIASSLLSSVWSRWYVWLCFVHSVHILAIVVSSTVWCIVKQQIELFLWPDNIISRKMKRWAMLGSFYSLFISPYNTFLFCLMNLAPLHRKCDRVHCWNSSLICVFQAEKNELLEFEMREMWDVLFWMCTQKQHKLGSTS